MKKSDALKYLEGAAAGLAIGVAVSMFLTSKKGKALRKDVKEKMADFYQWITPKLKEMGKMGKKEYKEFMKTAAIQYGKAKKISGDLTKEISKEAQKTWHYFSKHS